MLTNGAGTLIRRSGRLIFKCVLAVITAIGLYAMAAVALGVTAVNKDFSQKDGIVSIYVRGNGVHSDIVVPVLNYVHDWRGEFQHLDPTESAPFISFSWGDRGFYLETPRWRDVRASIAFTALSGLGNTLMRVEFAGPPETKYGDVVVRLSEAQYRRLVERIRTSFRRGPDGRSFPVDIPYNRGRSHYFEAIGSYSLLHTCNDWTRATLTAAGVRMPVWSPFYSAIFHQLRQIPAQQQ